MIIPEVWLSDPVREESGSRWNQIVTTHGVGGRSHFTSTDPCALELLALGGLMLDAHQHIGLPIMALDPSAAYWQRIWPE